jgi:hypothetical protein
MATETPETRDTAEAVDAGIAGLSDASPVLLLDTGGHQSDTGTCRRLLVPEDEDVREAVVLSLTTDSSEYVEQFVDSQLRTLHVITARKGASSTTVTLDGTDERTEVITERVSDPSDLPRLGIAVSNAIEECDAAGRTHICIDSLTAMLQYADRGRIFRFVQVLQDRISQSSAVAHYHLNPAAHDEQTVETLRQLFGAVVRVPSGEPPEIIR